MIVTNEMIHNVMKETAIFYWGIFKPYLIPFITGLIVWGICKSFVHRVVRFFSVILGDTKGETKRKLKTSDNIIDLVSTLNDIRPKK